MLYALERGERIDAPVCVVVAHPDDETLGLGGRLARFARLRLIHLTDGSPEDPSDARRLGFADRQAYARARAEELDKALDLLGVAPERTALNLPDQGVVDHLPQLIACLRRVLQDAAIVITHAYEGGHPDHDAAALAVQAACGGLSAAPARLEFAGYHLGEEGRVVGRFWPEAGRPEVRARLSLDALARKRASVACFRTQAEVTAWFTLELETYRQAPTYAFHQPPPPGRALYDQWGLSTDSIHWRARAQAALRELAT